MTVTQQGEDRKIADQRIANDLLNTVMTFARLVLRRYGELGPFGFAMDSERQISRVKLEIPRLPLDAERQYQLLRDHLVKEARRGTIQAAAMAANIALGVPSKESYSDAVLIHIEQRSGACTEATVPYRIIGGHAWGLLPRRIVFGQVQANDCPATLFTD
jgi:hypothetical protein